MKGFFITFGMILALQFFALAGIVVAADETTTGGLAQLAGCSGPDCTACNVVDMMNGLIKWLIGIMFILCAVLLTVAGVRLVTSGGNSHVLDEAKGMFTNALIGLIIILAAWLLVDTVMRGLVGDDGKLATDGDVSGWLYWSQVQCQIVRKPVFDEKNILNLTYQDLLQGVGSWAVNGSGAMVSPCKITGYSGATPIYDCSSQLTECTQNAGGVPVAAGDGRTVACNANTSTGAVSASACSPLHTVTDPLAQQMENGAKLLWANTDPRLQKCAVKLGGTPVSAFRPASYQAHLKEVHTKWCDQGLQSNTETSCAAVKSTVSAEMSKHGLSCSRPVATNSNHTSGIAIDMSGANPDNASRACFKWYGSADPVHYTLIPGCTCP